MKRNLLTICLSTAVDYLPKHPELIMGGRSIHYAFLIQRNKILEWGTNLCGSPATMHGYPAYSKLHAEYVAYRRARGIMDLGQPFEVVNIRLNRSGRVKLSAPCPCCFKFLKTLGCRSIWFSTEAGFAKIASGKVGVI